MLEALHDLGHERLGLEPKPEHRNPEHVSLAQGDRVLTECIVHRIQAQLVMSTIDLDHEVSAPPCDVEIDPAVGTLPDHLATGLRQPRPSAENGEVQLAEGMGSVRLVESDLTNEGSTLSRGQFESALPQVISGG